VDAHPFSQQAQDIQMNTVEQKNDGHSIMGPLGNFVDRINGTSDHKNVRGLL
jgi:hypothetical protein